MDREALDRLSREELLELVAQQAEVIGQQQAELAEREAAIERRDEKIRTLEYESTIADGHSSVGGRVMQGERTRTRRFDDIVRSERYFTATMLPAILLHDGFRGLDAFLALIDECARLRDGPPTERNRAGQRAVRSNRRVPWSRDRVEVISEFHIDRDLRFAHLIEVVAPSSQAHLAADQERRDAPDLVLVLDDELVICEGKFFDGYNLVSLNAQLNSQRRQVCHLLTLRQEVRAYRHVVILPVEGREPLECDVVITWSAIAELAARVLGKNHYVTARLDAAVTYWNAIHPPPCRNYDGVLHLEAMLDLCRARGDTIHVGHAHGPGDLVGRSHTYLQQKRWKWRDPATNRCKVLPKNWIPGSLFAEIIEKRRRQAAAAAQERPGSSA